MDKPLLAYQAHDGDERSCVVFATNGAAARRFAANEMDCDFTEVEFCRRVRSLDQYAPGPVPPQALIRLGWWYECWGCERRVDNETPRPVYISGSVYCCPWCRLDDLADTLITKAEQQSVKDRLTAFAESRWPGVKVVGAHAYTSLRQGGAVRVEDAHVEFTFPGGQHAVQYRESDRDPASNGPWVCAIDLPAWEAFAASIATPEVPHVG